MTAINPKECIIYHQGGFDDDTLQNVSTILKEKFSEDPKLGSTLFALFVELAQSIAHEASDMPAENIIGIQEQNHYYYLRSYSKVNKLKGEDVVKRISDLNRLNDAGLKEIRRQLRAAPFIADTKNGDMGFVQIIIRSKQPIQASLMPSESAQFVHLWVSVAVQVS